GPRRIDATVDCGTRRPLAGAEARVARVLVPAVDAREDAGEHVTCRSQPLSCGLESVGTLQPRDNRFLATLGEDSPGDLQHLVTDVSRHTHQAGNPVARIGEGQEGILKPPVEREMSPSISPSAPSPSAEAMSCSCA